MPQRRPSIREQFYERYGREPDSIWLSPGRVNLIGDHTDYQGGLALPIALPYSTRVAGRLRQDRMIHIYSDYGREDIHLPADDLSGLVKRRPLRGLMGFVAAVWHLLEYEQGIDLLILSTLPIASGLSSSASLSLGILAVMTELLGKPVVTEQLIAQARRVENDYLGVSSGILDPLAIARGRADFALLVDALRQDGRHVPFDYARYGLTLWIIDTQTPRTLAASGYDRRVRETQAASHVLGVPDLRRATPDSVERLTDPVLRARARHVVRENQRVELTVAAAGAGNWERVKSLFWASHQSLSEDFMVSTPVLDQTVGWLREMGVGARLTGAGFGGSAVALAASEQGEEMARRLTEHYRDKGWTLPRFLEVRRPAQGLRKVTEDKVPEDVID